MQGSAATEKDPTQGVSSAQVAGDLWERQTQSDNHGAMCSIMRTPNSQGSSASSTVLRGSFLENVHVEWHQLGEVQGRLGRAS